MLRARSATHDCAARLKVVTGGDAARLFLPEKSRLRAIRWILGLAALGQE
jgi:hypothetical protein